MTDPQKYIMCTGGAGYIGSHTVVELKRQGYQVAIVDNFSNSCKEAIDGIQELAGEVQVFDVDLLDLPGLEEVFKKISILAVIHFAGLKAVGESVKVPLDYYTNNLTGTLNLLRLMEVHKVHTLVFSSSATVYQASDTPIKENFPLGASNPYGWTKFMIEQMLMDLQKSDPQKWKIGILRYFNPIGAHNSGRIGESPQGCPNNLLPVIQQVYSGTREFLGVFGSDYPTKDGSGVRDYIHVDDLAEGHVATLKKLFASSDNPECLILNLGTGTGYSVHEMVAAFEVASGKDIPTKIEPRRPGDLASVIADPTKAWETLGWKTQKSLGDAMESTVSWMHKYPGGFKSGR